MGTVTRWAERKWPSGGLERCTVAALAEAHQVINRPKTKTDRIVLLHSVYRSSHSSKRSSRMAIMDPASAAISTVSVRLIMCARAVAAPSCSGFTIDQIGGIMGTCPPSPAARKTTIRNAGTSTVAPSTSGRSSGASATRTIPNHGNGAALLSGRDGRTEI